MNVPVVNTESLSAQLARWSAVLSFEAIPPTVVEDTKLRILDTIGVTVAASVTRPGRIVCEAVQRTSPGLASHVLGFGEAVAPAGAALANGTMAHVHDYDDTHAAARAHISAPMVATVLALGEECGASGREVLTAMAAGSEIAARLGAMAPGAFHEHGFHATGIVGAIGAAFAAGKLLRLDAATMQNACGIAASQAAGIAECFADGTWTKRLHSGWAAHSGIHAARLAQAGFTGPIKSLDGPRGLFNAHLGEGEHRYPRAVERLGREWLSVRSSFKPFPCGHLLHAFVEAALRLHRAPGMTLGPSRA